MKFFVCGGLDAPDWVLAEITTLSKLSSVNTKLLATHVVLHILQGAFDYEKVSKLVTDVLGISDIKACIALAHFVITSAAKFDLDENTLSKELQQLGLPKEHTDALCLPYQDNKDQLQAKLLQQRLKIPALCIDGWQVRVGGFNVAALMRLCSKEKKLEDDILICTTSEKLQILLHELKTARSIMEET